MSKTLQNATDQGIQYNNFSSCVTSFETQSPTLHGESKLLEQCYWNFECRNLKFSYEIPSFSSSMALQSNTDLRLLYGLLSVYSLIDLSFQFVILHLLIPVCRQFHYLFFGRPLSRLHWGLIIQCLKYFSFTIHSVNMTNPIQPTYSDKWRYIEISKLLHKFLLYRFLLFLFTFFPPNTLFKTFLSKVTSRLVIYLFSVQDSAPYVAAGLINVL
jgi:hypothetical protein